MNKNYYRKEGDELQRYLAFRKRAFYIKNKKGKGSYNRKRFKQKKKEFNE